MISNTEIQNIDEITEENLELVARICRLRSEM